MDLLLRAMRLHVPPQATRLDIRQVASLPDHPLPPRATSPPFRTDARSSREGARSHMETLVIHELGPMKFTTHNHLYWLHIRQVASLPDPPLCLSLSLYLFACLFVCLSVSARNTAVPHDAHLLLRSNASFYHSALLKAFLFGFPNKHTFSSAE